MEGLEYGSYPFEAHSRQKQSDNFDEIFQAKAHYGKYLKDRMLIKLLPTFFPENIL